MSKDIKKALEHCVEWKCDNCPNRDELGSGEIVCRGRLLPGILEYVSDLEAKLAESEKSKESYRLQNEHHHLQLLQFYSRLGVEAFGADIHEKALETLMLMKEELEEKNGVERALSACNRQNDEFAEMIKKLVSEKEELKQQLAEKDKEIEYYKKQAKKLNSEAQKYFEDAYCNDFHNQDKISFALEQLEQIRKEFEIKFKGCKWEDKMLVGKFCNITNEIIDNQIKAIKEGK